jgi:ABC-type multidrug transport system ATPase subunit
MVEWYLRDAAGRSSGPHPTPAILQWIATGHVGDAHQVCSSAASQQWLPITGVPVFAGALAARARSSQVPSHAQAYSSQLPPQPTSLRAPAAAAPETTPGPRPFAGTMAVPSLMEAEVLAAVRAIPQAAGGGGAGIRGFRTMYGQMAFGGPGSVPTQGRVAVIGRMPGVDFVLPFVQVSGRHAGVAPTPDGMLAVTDYGSTNGTHVGGKRLLPNVPVKIKPGDKIFIGPYPLYLGLEGGTVRAWADTDRPDWSGNLVEIEARNLLLEVPDRENKSAKKVLLNHVTFKANPGDLIALMGPSGAGKTTLLTVLNGYLKPTSGEVRVNGENLYAIYDALRGSIGYVPQDDIVHSELTVFEAIKYSAKFRLPPDYSDEEINRRVEQVIQDLGLEPVKNLEIGKPERKVLSGGQRKRVNIALELVTDPALMFLDEPTSGLAADDTVALIDLLASLAKKYGKTILVTIHQPAREEYEKFNLALILAHGGEPIYYGPTGKDSYAFFGRYVAQKGIVIDNPRDMFDLLRKREEDMLQSGQFRDKAAARAASSSAWRAEYYNPDNPIHAKMYTGARQPGKPTASRAPSRAKVPLLRQFGLLFRRYTTVKWRDRAGTAILFAQAPIIGALLAIMFASPAKAPNPWCQQFLQQMESAAAKKGALVAGCNLADLGRFPKVADFGGAIFFLAVVSIWFGTSNAAREIVSEQAIYRRERMVNLSIVNYVMSKFSLLSLFCVVQNVMLLTIVFFALGLGDYDGMAYLTMLGFMIATSMCAVALGLLLSTLVVSSEAAMALTPIALIPQVVMGGRMLPMTNKSWFEYVMAGIPARWSFEGLISAERTEVATGWKIPACVSSGAGISGGKFNCAIEEISNRTQGSGGLGFSTYDAPGISFGVLAGISLLCLVLVMILLKRRDSV